jgi:murein DD-endopeptidase MepM/ murein hydrolase activator NlpD
MITGRPEADDAVDDESAPALRKATEQFLAADAGIAEITKQQHAMDAAREGAGRAAADYQALGQEAANLRGQANDLSTRHDAAVRTIVAYARTAYRNGRLGVDADDAASSLAVSARRLVEARTRAELRLGAIATRQAGAREEFNRFSAQYTGAVRALADATQRLNQLAAQRATALAKAQAARHEDLTRHQVRLAESGRFGDQIRSAAQALRASGRAVSGTGRFGRPAVGPVTSSFGPRLHPILGYVKLHTGVDFGRGDGTVYAADDGTVLYTMVSTAYGNLTVVDHGVIAGRHITTAYAHQAQFLVQPGDRVGKGQAIGLIGSTGYSTGPHLHFEVRDDGVPVDPMPWLSAR